MRCIKTLTEKTVRICTIAKQFHKCELPVHWFSTENQDYAGLAERMEPQLLYSQHIAIQTSAAPLYLNSCRDQVAAWPCTGTNSEEIS